LPRNYRSGERLHPTSLRIGDLIALLNHHLIDELLLEGKGVVKAEETDNFTKPWIFTAVIN